MTPPYLPMDLDRRVLVVETRMESLEEKVDKLDEKVDERFERMEGKLDTLLQVVATGRPTGERTGLLTKHNAAVAGIGTAIGAALAQFIQALLSGMGK